MTFAPVSNAPFEHYFYKRAQLADDLAASNHFTDANILATASLDALAEIWFNDFPNIEKEFGREFGGKIPSSIRLARFLKRFVSNDLCVSKVAVVCFAEDWKCYCPQDAHIADQLLSKRLSNHPNAFFASHFLPDSSLDMARDELAQECPDLKTFPGLFDLLERYEYGALLYTFYRCPLIHFATESRRVHGLAQGEETMYYWHHHKDDKIAIGFGPNLVTRWLRDAVSGYVTHCLEENIIPANNLDAGIKVEKRFKVLWEKVSHRWQLH